MSRKPLPCDVTTIGIDIGKNTFHLIGLDRRGAITMQLKVSRAQLERRLANVPTCLIGMEACSGAHHIGRQLEALGHDVRLIPAQYVKPQTRAEGKEFRGAAIRGLSPRVAFPCLSGSALATVSEGGI